MLLKWLRPALNFERVAEGYPLKEKHNFYFKCEFKFNLTFGLIYELIYRLFIIPPKKSILNTVGRKIIFLLWEADNAQ